MRKIAFIIPGYAQSHLNRKGYNKIAEFFKSKNINPVHIKINWHSKNQYSFENYVNQFLKQTKKYKKSEIYILGFSYGAITAFLSEPIIKPKIMILCSLSPYFIEDFKNLEPNWLKWYKKYFKNNEYSFNKFAKKIKSKTYLIVGNKEPYACLIRARAAKRKIKDSSLSTSKNAKHNISQKEYLKTIKKVINKL